MKRIKDNGFADIKIKFKNGSEFERTVDYAPIQVDDILNYVKTHYLIEKVASIKVRSGQYWETIYDNGNISDSRKIKDDKEYVNELKQGYRGMPKKAIQEELDVHYLEFKDLNKREYESLCKYYSIEPLTKGSQPRYADKIVEYNGWAKTSDSRKIKDENTMNVLDGVLFIAFTDGTEDDMIAEVNKHANESDTIDGVQYETYETDNSDGVAMIDLCAATGDANAFVKALLKEWGIAENVADLEFQASDEMKEAVSDSRRVSDMTKPAHLRGYAEKVRANRRKKNEETENEPENEKQDVADSRIRDNALPSFDINGFTGEPAVSGDYYKLTYGRETIYQDSANEDCYDEDSAYAFFEELLNGIGKQGQLAIQAAIDNGFTVSGTDSIETVWQDACDYIIDNTEHVMEYCELVTNNRGQHYDFGEYWQDGEIFDFNWHYKESDHVLFRQEGNDFVWVNWFDVPMDGEPDRADYGFVFDTIVYDGEAIDLYDMFV